MGFEMTFKGDFEWEIFGGGFQRGIEEGKIKRHSRGIRKEVGNNSKGKIRGEFEGEF
jgi:hypothetical protein